MPVSKMRYIAPLTLAAAEATGADWRERLAWPAPVAGDVEILETALRNYLDATFESQDHDSRSVALLSRRFMPILALVQAAVQVAAEGNAATALSGGPEINFLRGEIGIDGLGATSRSLRPPARPPKFRWLRGALRTSTWTSYPRLPRALFGPDGIALQHNALMRRWIERHGLSIRAAHADEVPVTNVARKSDDVDVEAIARKLAAGVVSLPGLPEPVSSRLMFLLERIFTEDAADAISILNRLRARPRVPGLLLTGTGSRPYGRALGLEVLRRGGEVVRFSHGGSEILLDNPISLAERELVVSGRYILPSSLSARTKVVCEAVTSAQRFRLVDVSGGNGDPSLDPGAASISKPNARYRPRVMYIGTAYYGFQQVYPPLLPAPLYLDWQIRLMEQLRELPIDIVCKPHPGGVRNGYLALTAYSTVTTERFETALSDADVLIYDYPATTTLSIGLCSDRRIVLIDHGTMRFNETVRPHVEARCRIVRANWDERNRPIVNRTDLADAVCGGPTRADPSYFRKLFLDESLWS